MLLREFVRYCFGVLLRAGLGFGGREAGPDV